MIYYKIIGDSYLKYLDVSDISRRYQFISSVSPLDYAQLAIL